MKRSIAQLQVLPISPIVANLFMEEFESKAVSTALNLLRFWLRYDTFVIQQAELSQQFLYHINSDDPDMQLTTEAPSFDGFISFLDTLVSQGHGNKLLTSVYRKPSHTD